MAKLDKEALMAVLQNSLGEDVLNGIDFDDDTLNGLIVNEDDDTDDNDDDNDDDDSGDDTDNNDTSNNNDDDDDDGEDDEIGLENIDVTQLTAGEKMIYDAFMSEKKKSAKQEINTLISTSGVGDKHRAVLKRMAKNGIPLSVIRETVEDFKEVENTSNRVLGRKRIVPKGKVKTFSKKKGDKTPKIGSREFGKLLANKKK